MKQQIHNFTLFILPFICCGCCCWCHCRRRRYRVLNLFAWDAVIGFDNDNGKQRTPIGLAARVFCHRINITRTPPHSHTPGDPSIHTKPNKQKNCIFRFYQKSKSDKNKCYETRVHNQTATNRQTTHARIHRTFDAEETSLKIMFTNLRME